MRGILITFEGVEGSGKSTQVELLVHHLREIGLDCVVSREPGGTPIGERVRDILLDPSVKEMAGLTELLLYLASRNQHVIDKVLPALRSGQIVVIDRFADSSIAYQGFGRRLGVRVVSRLNKLVTCALRPDLTFLVDIPVGKGRERKAGSVLDRLEREDVEFHERVRLGYLRLARRAPGRIKVLDGTLPADRLAEVVRIQVDDCLRRKGVLR
ncbi:MAG: dTMP kinase [candidate division WOR-3 bacterium]